MADLHELLTADHERLAAMFDVVTRAAQGDDEASKREALAEFETALVAHFEGEEKYLFPQLAADFPEEIMALREEHELIRRDLSELIEGDALARDAGPRAVALVEQLRRHARREDTMLYALANDPRGGERYRALIAFLEQTYARLRHT